MRPPRVGLARASILAAAAKFGMVGALSALLFRNVKALRLEASPLQAASRVVSSFHAFGTCYAGYVLLPARENLVRFFHEPGHLERFVAAIGRRWNTRAEEALIELSSG